MEAFEESECFPGVLKMAERLRLEAQVEVDLVLLRKILDVVGEARQILADDGFVGVEGLVGAGKGRDGSARGSGSDLSDDIEQVPGVFQSLRGGPIR